MFWLALRVTAGWARTRWPLIALAVACTPVLMYSASMAAPNGLEILAAVTLWSALIGMVKARADVPRATVTAAVVASSVLVTLRALGPLWCLLIVVCVLLVATRRRELVRNLAARGDVRVGLAVVIAFLGAALSWSASQRPIGSGASHATLAQVRAGLVLGVQSELGWLLQSVAVFPFRTQLAPLVVYPCAAVLFLGLVVSGLRRAPGRVRITLELMALTGLVLPIGFTALSYGPLHEVAWQGRYALPFVLGLLVIAGSIIDDAGTSEEPGWPLLGAIAVLFLLVQVPGPIKVLLNERATSPFAGSSVWPMPTPTAIGVLATAGAMMMMWGAARTPRATGDGLGTPEPARRPAARETAPHR
jgi:hypothetical protein